MATSGHPERERFPTTEWPLLADLANSRHRVARLDRLLRLYRAPMLGYVRALTRWPQSDAEDLTQSFCEHLVRNVDFSQVRPDKGRFRAFLKVALRHWVVDEVRRRSRSREVSGESARAGAVAPLADGALPAHDQFERAWLAVVLDRAQKQLMSELARGGKSIHEEVFRRVCLEPDDPPKTLAAVSEELGLTLNELSGYLRFTRRRGREIVRRILREYLLPDEDVEEELAQLLGRRA